MKIVVNANGNIVYNCHSHLVFCPKYRGRVLVDGVDTRLQTLIAQMVEKWGRRLSKWK